MSNPRRSWRFAGPALALFLLIADQVTKWQVLQSLKAYEPIEVTSFFNLVLVWNTGVSFGMFQGGGDVGRWVLIAVALVISVGVLFWLKKEQRWLPKIALWMVLAGALGNVIDRFRFGAVVDFLDFHLFEYHWPAFNIADSAIVVGAVILLVDGLFAGGPTIHEVRKES